MLAGAGAVGQGGGQGELPASLASSLTRIPAQGGIPGCRPLVPLTANRLLGDGPGRYRGR
ncbi:hypothetical protein GCM10025734_56710 [Kitasatospora paranensis]